MVKHGMTKKSLLEGGESLEFPSPDAVEAESMNTVKTETAILMGCGWNYRTETRKSS